MPRPQRGRVIVVTGASGTVGSHLVRLLTERSVAVRAITRDPARLARLAGGDVEVVAADFTDPRSLRRAASGAAAVFLATAPGAHVPDHDRAMIDAASAVGVRKMVKLSAISGGSGRTPNSAPADWHRPGEEALAASGRAWVVLRPTWYASNTLAWAETVRGGGPVSNPTGEGAQGVIDPRDVAAVAAAVLGTDTHDRTVLTLTGPQLLSVPQLVERLAVELGRPMQTVDVSPRAIGEQLRAAGADPSVVEAAVAGYEQIASGGNAVLTEDVSRTLGRPARTFCDWARDHRTAFERV
jgi:uncharacterized protein YbjT (DUF2867 family)